MSFLKPKASKSVQESLSENINNDLIKSKFGGTLDAGGGATNFIAKLLGIGADGSGDPMGGYQNYLQLAGFVPAMKQLGQGITGGAAAAGLLNSGSTRDALLTRGAELNNSFFKDYLAQLQGLSGLGLQAGGLVANTGQKSTSSGTSTGGGPSTFGSLMSTIGGIASIFSDRDLKRDIVLEGEDDDGLGIYSYRYVGEDERHVGVMADEVRKIRPWALGPKVGGYDTVNYERL